jgi:hypothetical protein
VIESLVFLWGLGRPKVEQLDPKQEILLEMKSKGLAWK